jgi:hypothetical protein
MEDLGFDYIFGENEIENLFVDDASAEETAKQPETEDETDVDGEETNGETEKTTEVDPDDLFGEKEEEKPESVGSEKNKEAKEQGDSSADDGGGTSPKNFYSSIANAAAEDGVFPNLDDETIKKVNDAESFSELFDLEINARLNDAQRRIKKALEDGVEPTDIKKYENTLNYIASITDANIAEESEKGEQLRRNLIYQDFLNKGYSPEKAQKFTERTIDAGTDVEDAKEALQSNKEYFQGAYNKLLREAEEEAQAEREERQQQAARLKDSILKDKNLFGDIELSADVRKKAFDNISKPIYRDPETGEYFTALQKYEMENRADFLKYTGLVYTLTNGFKDFDSFTKGKVKKEVRKGLRELEQTLNNTSRNTNGSLKMVTGVQDDPESYISKGMQLDI